MDVGGLLVRAYEARDHLMCAALENDADRIATACEAVEGLIGAIMDQVAPEEIEV